VRPSHTPGLVSRHDFSMGGGVERMGEDLAKTIRIKKGREGKIGSRRLAVSKREYSKTNSLGLGPWDDTPAGIGTRRVSIPQAKKDTKSLSHREGVISRRKRTRRERLRSKGGGSDNYDETIGGKRSGKGGMTGFFMRQPKRTGEEDNADRENLRGLQSSPQNARNR